MEDSSTPSLNFEESLDLIFVSCMLQDPNADINEMFDMVEQVASAPKKFFDSMFKK